MMVYNEEQFLMLSGLQHFVFCRRQWALIHIEQVWVDNVLTVEGNALHEKADDPFIREKRGDTIYVRALPIHSHTLGISGICDMVEFTRTVNGITLANEEGQFVVKPIEYKKGAPKKHDADIAQLVAQVLCLEEMLQTTIDEAALYYHETRRREIVMITTEWRDKVIAMIKEMHQYYERQHTPRVKTGKHCKSCSLQHICLPELLSKESVFTYIDRVTKE
ncbi:CRISPR-associated protein Cas4 [Metasolibacillus meyeri]|uniref:CRISPR-associated exonuclease Cas4 n=2 Tax=Metasolibacillus meyeri TaxID=1071052 RepID=A0AAW9NQ13_9BACL|nr:CRISPR-associated protein Cas4 [Metasolibacillus meyeri]